MMLAMVGKSMKGGYSAMPLGNLGPTPGLACCLDLHMNCKGAALRGRGQCSCECHDETEHR